MSKRMFNGKVVGEIWYDHAGHECVYRENGTLKVSTVNTEPTQTIQSEKDACDLNKIYEKYTKTGIMTNVRRDQPTYGDFSNIVDYHTAVMRVQEAEEQFMTLPARIRARFKNDPGELIEFLGKDENRAEAIELGLIDPPQANEVPQGEVKGTPPASEGSA